MIISQLSVSRLHRQRRGRSSGVHRQLDKLDYNTQRLLVHQKHKTSSSN